jgi:Polyketide cyclase / dehydrase and lipid transport
VKVSAVRELPVPAARAWQALVDWPGQGGWMPFTRVRTLPGPPDGVGARIEASTGVGPLQVVDPMEIVEWDAPRRCVMRHDGRVLRGTGTFEVVPYGPGRCLVRWEEDLRQPVASLTWLAKPFFAWALRRLERSFRAG